MTRSAAITEAVRRVRGRGWDYSAKPYRRWVASEEKLVGMVAEVLFQSRTAEMALGKPLQPFRQCYVCQELIRMGQTYRAGYAYGQAEFPFGEWFRHASCAPLSDWAKKGRGR